MRFAFSKILILIVLIAEICGSDLKTIYDTFDEVLVMKLMLPNGDKVKQMLNQFNEPCMSEYMQLSTYGQQLINEFEQNVLFDSASYKCTEWAADQLDKILKRNIIKQFRLDENEEFIACLSSKLFELEPTTKLASDDRTKTCKTSFVDFLPEHLQSHLDNSNKQVVKSSCGQISADYNTKVFIKQYLMLVKNVETNVRKMEELQLLKEMKFMWKVVYDCMMNRFKNENEN